MLPPIQSLIAEYEQARDSGDDRATAETAYALAHRMMDAGDIDQAEHYAKASLAAAIRVPSNHLDDVAGARIAVGGVPLPDYFHDDVIRSRLGGLLND